MVIVATCRALKLNGGADKNNLTEENLPALEKGMANLRRHVKNMQNYGLPIVVAINHFTSDTEAEIKTIQDAVAEMGVKAIELMLGQKVEKVRKI